MPEFASFIDLLALIGSDKLNELHDEMVAKERRGAQFTEVRIQKVF